MGYKWQLKKGGAKLVCPACGVRRFVPYVLSADNKTEAGREFGRCDRETSCGYHRAPGHDVTAPDITPAPRIEEVTLYFYPFVLQDKKSNLFTYIAKLTSCAYAAEAWEMYHVSSTADGHTIFWQIDINGNVRSGKAIHYKPDGHRDKNSISPVAWCHKLKEFDGTHIGNKLVQCFFGEHLLLNNNKPVMIVESEKTAVVCSIFMPEFVWLACGGSQNLKNPIKNKVLMGRNVTLIPDNNQYYNWLLIALKNRWNISKIMENDPPFEGADILDKIERHEEIEL